MWRMEAIAPVPVAYLRRYRYCEKIHPGYAMAVRMNRADRGHLRRFGC